MADSWGLGTDQTRVGNTLDTQDNLVNVGKIRPALKRAVVQRRLANNQLVEDSMGRSRSWAITQEALDDPQRAAIITLLNTTSALYFRDDINGTVYEVRTGDSIDDELLPGYRYNISYTLESVSGAV